MKRQFIGSLIAAALLAACGSEESTTPRDAASTSTLAIEAVPGGPATASAKLPAALAAQTGMVDVWVTLDQPSLVRTRAMLAQSTGIPLKRAQTAGARASASRAEPQVIRTAMAAQKQVVLAQQADYGRRLTALGGRELGRATVAHNAIAISVDASRLPAIAALPGVLRVRPVVHHQLDLSETVPYVGGAAVQAAGFDGTGVRVAVMDSGIDYTHKNLGGAGTAEAYAAAWGTSTTDPKNTTRDDVFPTAKVVDGYDFVGEAWPNGPRTEDPDPIDLQGHGTHVADIIGGRSTDGTHKGMAPGASLIAVKVCSAVATSCNGVALLLGVDYAMDPNGDGDISDAADVINLSLGSSFGQIEDDLTFSLQNAVDAGAVVVASAGNSANRPYIVGSPSIGLGVISVAQTAVPSATSIPLVVNAPTAIAGVYGNTATVEWAPITSAVTGDVKTALQAGAANNLGCAALPAGSLTGKIALIDRGTCSVSIKVDFAAKAGATGVLIGLVAPGDAVSFSNGGGDTFVPTLVIQQSLANAIKARQTAGDTVNVSLSPAAAIPLAGSMAGTSSRGPAIGTHLIKPEIGAPGASVSAIAGSGTGTEAFGGTSGAAPMVSGAAALLLQAHPGRNPLQIKAMLMNSAEIAVYTNPAVAPGVLAPISRIGAGELRVDRALGATATAWEATSQSAALSFGAIEASKQTVIKRTLTVENYASSPKTYAVATTFRFANDEASEAVKLNAPASVTVPANGSASVEVTMVINPARLASWPFTGGSSIGNGALLDGPEYDGYLTLSAGNEKLSVPWHVLPRKAAVTSVLPYQGARTGSTLQLKNVGVDLGPFDTFSLTGTSPVGGLVPAPKPGDGYGFVDLKAVGVRYIPSCGITGGCLQFAIASHDRRSHPAYPAGIEVDIDTNGDGTADYFVFQEEQTSFGSTGASLVYVQQIGSTTRSAFFFNIADLNSANTIYTVPLAALGITSPTTTIGFEVFGYDNYHTGSVTDYLGGMKFTPATPRYTAASGSVPPAGTGRLPFVKASVTNSSETGLLFMFGRNDGAEAQAVTLP